MNKKRLIDYGEVRNLFNEEFKKTMQLIQAGETHLDNLAEGFTEADRVLFKLMLLSPQTNADRIRAMSDEELAELLDKAAANGCIDHARDCRESCVDCIHDWLRQPVKDGDNE